MRDWLARNPVRFGDVVTAAASVLVGLTVWRAYRLGVATGALREVMGEADRLASEALGG